MKHRVEGHQGIYKDEVSGVIVNRSDTERERYRIAKQHALDNINSKKELSELKTEMEEIKSVKPGWLIVPMRSDA